MGERWTRNGDGSTGKIPANTTFEDWKKQFVAEQDSGLKKAVLGDKIELSDTEGWALNEYISSGSYKINALLRDGTPLTDEQKELARQLDAALEKLPVYQGTVYWSMDSSMIDTELFWAEHTPGNIVYYPAYTSSSAAVYDKTMDIQMTIQSKSARDLRRYNPGEQELLFPRNCQFVVKRREGNMLWLEEI